MTFVRGRFGDAYVLVHECACDFSEGGGFVMDRVARCLTWLTERRW